MPAADRPNEAFKVELESTHSPFGTSSCRQKLVVAAMLCSHLHRETHNEGPNSCCHRRCHCQHRHASNGAQLEAQRADVCEIPQPQGMPRRSAHAPVHFAPRGSAIAALEELAFDGPLDLTRMAGDATTVGAHDLVHGGQGVVCLVVQLVRFVLGSVAPTIERVHHRMRHLLQMRGLAGHVVRGCELWIQLGTQCKLQLIVEVPLDPVKLKADPRHIMQERLGLIAQLFSDGCVGT